MGSGSESSLDKPKALERPVRAGWWHPLLSAVQCSVRYSTQITPPFVGCASQLHSNRLHTGYPGWTMRDLPRCFWCTDCGMCIGTVPYINSSRADMSGKDVFEDVDG